MMFMNCVSEKLLKQMAYLISDRLIDCKIRHSITEWAKIIVKCSLFKNPSRSNTGKYVKYIGTRDGVEKLPYGYDDRPFTKKQQKLIASITERFPDNKKLDEYKTFKDKCFDNNKLRPYDRENQTKMLKDILGKMGKDVIVTPPV